MELTRPHYEMPGARDAGRYEVVTPVAPKEPEPIATASNGFAIAMGALAVSVAVIIGIAVHVEGHTFQVKTEMQQAQMAAPAREGGDPFHLGAKDPFDAGAGLANIERELPAANAACGGLVPTDTTLHVRGTYDPDGYMNYVEIDSGAEPETARCLVKTLMSATVRPFGGGAQSVEGDITLWPH